MNELREILNNLEYSLPKDIIWNLERVIRSWAKGKVPVKIPKGIIVTGYSNGRECDAYISGCNDCQKKTLKNIKEE